jgi:glycine/D-amino acid oxidase-like deaminating enzyme
MMNLKTGYPYPLIRIGLPFDYPKLEKNIRTDVLVLGGGISGALIAHYLIKEGVDCVVLDARTIGLGSTAASTSLLQYEIDTPLRELVQLTGYKNAVKAYKLCGKAIHNLGALAEKIGLNDFRYKPSLHYALKAKDLASLKEEYGLLKKNGFRVKLLGESAIKKEFGFKSPGALLSDLGADTNAYLFTHLLHQYNITRGLKVFDRSPADKIRHEKKGVDIRLVNGFNVKAKKIDPL